jgi:glycerol-3-phosphate acyltransferase PlsY
MAFYISKHKNVDLRTHGSGNLGTSNTAIVLGWGPGIAVGLHDIGKGALAVWLASFLFPDLPFVGASAGVACVFGHNYPFYLRFKGGKGFAAFVGMMLMLNWKMGLLLLVAVAVITVVTDYLVLGTFTTIAAVPVWQGIENRSMILFLILLAGSGIILWQHRENITRLRNGTEIGLRSTSKGEHKVK